MDSVDNSSQTPTCPRYPQPYDDGALISGILRTLPEGHNKHSLKWYNFWGEPQLLLALIALLLTFSLSRVATSVYRNIGNISAAKANYVAKDAERFFLARQATNIYQKLPETEITKDRLLMACKLLWQSASSLERKEEALKAYNAGRNLEGNYQPTTVVECSQVFGRLEAENFEGVEENTMAVTRLIDNRWAVLLFSMQPISYSVCLPTEGLYEIRVISRENAPAPVDIEVYWNDWFLGLLRYDRGDEKWASESVKLASFPGWHVLKLRYSNDFRDPVSGIDRNAMIDYVEIGPLREKDQ